MLNQTINYMKQSWLVILLALLYGGGLAGVETALSGKIAANKRNETYQVIPNLVQGADPAQTEPMTVEAKNGKPMRVYKAKGETGAHKGWVVPVSGQGFADRIELLIGLDESISTITGIYILDQKETPGLGDHITSQAFRQRFENIPTDHPLVVVKSNPNAAYEILALTGATVSSESVSTIVNSAIDNLKEPMQNQTARAETTTLIGMAN